MAESNDTIATLLRIQVSLLGRIAFNETALTQLVCRGRDLDKQRIAYNLCDGTRTQGEVAKAAKYDPGNFSRTVNRWLELGVLYRIPDGADSRLQHLYPLPSAGIVTE